jgi:copper chaperone
MLALKANTVSTILRSDELSCPSCVTKIEKSLRSLPGVESVRVRFSAGRIEVRHDLEQAGVDRLVEAVPRAGYQAPPSSF